MIEPYITTCGGGRIYPLGPRTRDFKTRDIAHSLSQICRYNGHTSEFWSVAAHSIEVSRILEEMGESLMIQFVGLMHDAGESCLCDIPRPIKPLVVGYQQWEATVDYVLAKKYGYPYPFPEVVKQVDNLLVLDEIRTFYPPGSDAWKRYGMTEADKPRTLKPLDPKHGERAFLARFAELCIKTNGRHGRED